MENFNTPLIDLQTKYMQKDPSTIAFCASFDSQTKEIVKDIEKILIYPNIKNLSEPLLDELAFQFNVFEYNTAFSQNVKAQIIQNALLTHRYRGTKYAVETVLRSVLGDNSLVQEWFEYGGAPFHFKVLTSNMAVTNEMADEFLRVLNIVKNVRSVLESIVFYLQLPKVTVCCGVGLKVGGYIRVLPKERVVL